MVMPAVASLAAARDERGLDRVKYDGTRLHIARALARGAVGLDLCRSVPVSLDRSKQWDDDEQTGVRPGGRDVADAAVPGRHAPLVLSVPVQMSIGINKIKVIALGGPGRFGRQPAGQLLPDRPAGRGGSDLGHGVDHAVLEFAGTRHLCLPRAGDRPANLS